MEGAYTNRRGLLTARRGPRAGPDGPAISPHTKHTGRPAFSGSTVAAAPAEPPPAPAPGEATPSWLLAWWRARSERIAWGLVALLSAAVGLLLSGRLA